MHDIGPAARFQHERLSGSAPQLDGYAEPDRLTTTASRDEGDLVLDGKEIAPVCAHDTSLSLGMQGDSDGETETRVTSAVGDVSSRCRCTCSTSGPLTGLTKPFSDTEGTGELLL